MTDARGGPAVSAALKETLQRIQLASEGAAAVALAAAHDRLGQPLRVAFVGRVSSGKSTLVNGLLGRELAATAAGECTLVAHHYEWGRWTGATAVTVDGERRPIAFPAAGPITELPAGLSMERVARIEVTEPLPQLEGLCVIDTPGLASAGSDASSRTAELLTERSLAAVDAADALVFVLTGPLHADERAAVQSFLGADGGAGVTALAVLNKADKIGPDPASSPAAARELAASLAAEHQDLFAAVLPTVGLLGQTGQAGLTEAEARALLDLADAWDAEQASLAVCDVELFCAEPARVPAATRRQIVNRLGLYGTGRLLAAAQEGRARDAYGLSDVAYRHSGLPALVRALRTSITERADPVKALRALNGLQELAHTGGADPELSDHLDALSRSPAMLPVRLARARGIVVAAGRLLIPDDLGREVHAASSPAGLPATRPDEAAQRVARWQSWSMLTTTAGRDVADAMCEAWRARAGAR